MKILLTGATGFVGRALCLRLARDGHELHAVVREGAPSQTGDFAWASVAAGLRARWRFAGPFAAELGGEVIAPFVRHRFFAGSNPSATVFQQSPIGASGYLGLALQFR